MTPAGPALLSPRRITPRLVIADPLAEYWFSQVVLRLRREISWCWHQRVGAVDPGTGVLPPATDPTAEALDLVRFEAEKERFLATDPAARYLTEQLAALERPGPAEAEAGGWSWLAGELGLGAADQFVLGLSLAAQLDGALAPLFAACLNDLSRPFPTLALAQRLWDEPAAVAACADPTHPLIRLGLLEAPRAGQPTELWQHPLRMPSVVARTLADPTTPLPTGVEVLSSGQRSDLGPAGESLALRLAGAAAPYMQVVPLEGPPGSDFAAWAATLAERAGRRVIAPDGIAALLGLGPATLAALAWLHRCDLFLPRGWELVARRPEDSPFAALDSLPLRWFVPADGRRELRVFPAASVLPALPIEGLTFVERLRRFREGLGERAEELGSVVEECARRFRIQERAIADVTRVARAAEELDGERLMRFCRGHVADEIGGLAQAVRPRFESRELVLPDKQRRQFDEVLRAMRSLTEVHYHWGTARVWNEGGLSVLFCGAPGTGKTMAAEALASELDLPMYRIDLSQVVDKYIGETEKNLRRIFDAAEMSDCLLFFDEADALFGKRTEVKDAHDRFANIEISYLLERMERFKGLAILATNRRKDLDDAFLRRVRYLLEFPLPGVEERRRIWQQTFPEEVDVSALDFGYLAKCFPLSGGSIRSIAFNACLQSAGRNGSGERRPAARNVGMQSVVLAVKRELEKMNHSVGREQFGTYSDLIEEWVA